MTARKCFLGVDGGQSSTTAMIGDDTGRVLGVGRAGPCNHVSTAESRAKFCEAIGGAVHAAAEAGGLSELSPTDGVHFTSACLGLSGGPEDKDALVREILDAEKYLVVNDAVIALSGATGGRPGVIAIAGTGAIAFGKNTDGRIARAGGWGYVFGDEGGAFDVVRQALRAALRQEEGWGPPTTLRNALIEATGAPDMNALLHWFYTPEFPKARIASYAKLVDHAARGGDEVARDILNASARELAALVAAVRRQLFQGGEPPRVSYIGGAFQSEILLGRFVTLVEWESSLPVHPPAFGPAAGALIEAYRLTGLRVQPQQAPRGV